MIKFINNRNKAIKIVMWFAGLIFFCPVLITFIFSLCFEGLFPAVMQYSELLITNNTFLRFFWNSMGYSLVTTVVCILISFPLGFLFAKIRFPGMDALFFIYIIALMLPFQSTLLPNYIQLRDFGLLNTPVALVLPLSFSPFAVFLFRQFIKSIPQELLDCTVMETSSPIQILRYAVLPQMKPATIALAVMIFCESWNMVEPAFIFTAYNQKIHPLSVVLGDLPKEVSFSAATIYLFPPFMLFLLFKEALADSMKKFHW
jgi:multiple sugar transport system permease protein